MQINTMKIKPSMNTSLNKQLVLSHLCFFCRLLAVDIQIFKVYIKKKKQIQGFPVGSVDKNVPVNAGDTGSVPGPGRFHMPWSN